MGGGVSLVGALGALGALCALGALVGAVGCAEPSLPDAATPKQSPHSHRPADVALATPAVTAYAGPARGLGAMPGVRPSRMSASLAAAGLDITNLPPLEALAPGPKQRVMRTFTEALGVPCTGCHAEDELTADTRRKRVARRMWNEIVRVVQVADGAPIYCDSCHDGALFHLDRRETKDLAAYMHNAMVNNVRRIDGRAHDCTTCHGDPPDFHLLASWKAIPAPDISRDPHAPGIVVPQWPTEGPRAPAECGPNAEHCPLAAWMRLVVAPAAVRLDADPTLAGSREALASALDHVAAYAPESAEMVATAKAAAAAARRGDPAAVRAECGRCHQAQKTMWRAQQRSRAPG